ALQFTQPILWRRKNWWRITLTVAGEGASMEGGEPTLYPVATQEEATHLLSLILPDLGVEDPLELIDLSLRGRGRAGGFVTSPQRARWIDPLVWRRTGYTATSAATIIRRGRLTRRSVIVPNARIQSLGAAQGPIERALGLANVAVHTTPGSITPVVPHLDLVDARRFIHAASTRARARYTATSAATIIRRGRLTRRSVIVPNARIQSLGAAQGPIERALGLANVAVHTTPGSITPVVPHLDLVDARRFIHAASKRARA